jgi:hypothetical protein
VPVYLDAAEVAMGWGMHEIVELADRLPVSQVRLTQINESSFDIANGATVRSKSCLADSNYRSCAAYDRERVIRARQAAEALFTSKPPVCPPAVQQIARPIGAQIAVLRIIPPTAPARHDEPETPAAPTPPAIKIPPAQLRASGLG